MAYEKNLGEVFATCWKCGADMDDIQVQRDVWRKGRLYTVTKTTHVLRCQKCGANTNEFAKTEDAIKAAETIKQYYDAVRGGSRKEVHHG